MSPARAGQPVACACALPGELREHKCLGSPEVGVRRALGPARWAAGSRGRGKRSALHLP
eukprot:CAMPEP_0204276980 /NCGR_PEP_ID=MMETSP0468-20130131/29040_1 /ASSEMBLY_ACC=CAM_ASM_000383 /TAXON_ID=2969 /ORGANISM="Oxyrrhis marina" /LENGTH=58 /DNA_ID=CAMNT_0051253691 /DNA_START=152 /DNA_END=324 /DNA_ORIENTATION=+